MSQLGLGVVLKSMCGLDETLINKFKNSINKKIIKIEATDTSLLIVFKDKTTIVFQDDGQSCCETRYMNKDNNLDLSKFTYSNFLGAEVKERDNLNDEYDVHEVCALEIQTSKGNFEVLFHNLHNGYYGGFYIVPI
jgi:hypothetical protein